MIRQLFVFLFLLAFGFEQPVFAGSDDEGEAASCSEDDDECDGEDDQDDKDKEAIQKLTARRTQLQDKLWTVPSHSTQADGIKDGIKAELSSIRSELKKIQGRLARRNQRRAFWADPNTPQFLQRLKTANIEQLEALLNEIKSERKNIRLNNNSVVGKEEEKRQLPILMEKNRQVRNAIRKRNKKNAGNRDGSSTSSQLVPQLQPASAARGVRLPSPLLSPINSGSDWPRPGDMPAQQVPMHQPAPWQTQQEQQQQQQQQQAPQATQAQASAPTSAVASFAGSDDEDKAASCSEDGDECDEDDKNEEKDREDRKKEQELIKRRQELCKLGEPSDLTQAEDIKAELDSIRAELRRIQNRLAMRNQRRAFSKDPNRDQFLQRLKTANMKQLKALPNKIRDEIKNIKCNKNPVVGKEELREQLAILIEKKRRVFGAIGERKKASKQKQIRQRRNIRPAASAARRVRLPRRLPSPMNSVSHAGPAVTLSPVDGSLNGAFSVGSGSPTFLDAWGQPLTWPQPGDMPAQQVPMHQPAPWQTQQEQQQQQQQQQQQLQQDSMLTEMLEPNQNLLGSIDIIENLLGTINFLWSMAIGDDVVVLQNAVSVLEQLQSQFNGPMDDGQFWAWQIDAEALIADWDPILSEMCKRYVGF